MTPVQSLLTAARALIENGWCQGAMAQDRTGKPLDFYRHVDAVKWCIDGAVLKVAEESAEFTVMDRREAFRCLEQVIGLTRSESLIAWNDAPGRTKQEVLDACDKAIVRAGDENEHTKTLAE